MDEGKPSTSGLEWNFLLVLLAIVTLAFAWLIEPFLGAILWGIILAVLFMPLNKRILGFLPGRLNSAAFLTLLIIIALVIAPALALGVALVGEASEVYERLRSGEIDFAQAFAAAEKALPTWMREQLEAYGFADTASIRERLYAGVTNVLEFLISQLFKIGQGAISFFLALGVTLYLTFFLLRDGDALARKIETAIPLHAEQRRSLLAKFIVVIRATINGTGVVAILQGAIGGFIFYMLDIPGALLWGVLMGFLSLIPAIGTGLVWAPVAIYLMVTGALWDGIILALCGVFIISMVDNVVRPILVGRETRIPDYIVLITTLSGLQLFGFNGIIIGPLLAAAFLAVWHIFAETHGSGDAQASA
ncbi:AI-2E family transporter [Sphingorhabdus sp. Alg239-R122]|uniref:AI-2E family transporter n=1 Tax=Sphingorhabdus sp. Alg239-R122 TaxID=2305989 RepID=UPI0013DA752A|nr:AI-2E family transporter [Sphingorhabdus sp. Alg239-R122]